MDCELREHRRPFYDRDGRDGRRQSTVAMPAPDPSRAIEVELVRALFEMPQQAGFPGKEFVGATSDCPVRQPAVSRMSAKPPIGLPHDEIPDGLVDRLLGSGDRCCPVIRLQLGCG
jgi:hypothetical protein